MLTLQNEEGIFWALESDVATIMPAPPQRWRVVVADGSLGYMSAEPPPGPWVQLAGGWAAPRHLRRLDSGHWEDPAGFRFAGRSLPSAPDWQPEDSDLLYLRRSGNKRWWHTDSGQTPCELGWTEVIQLYPELVLINKNTLVHRSRLRRLIPKTMGGTLLLDNGERLNLSPQIKHTFLREMGLATIRLVDPETPLLLPRLREYPYELAAAPAERLRADFHKADDLTLNLIWQAAALGGPEGYGSDLPSFLAHPLNSTLKKLGWKLTPGRLDLLLRVQLVLRDDLVRYRSLGFADPGPSRRLVGQRRPTTLLLAQAGAGVGPAARELAQQQGISLFLLGKDRDEIVHLEYLVPHLQELGPLRVVAWVNFGPAAWDNVDDFRQLAERLGLDIQGKTAYLVRPECFSSEDLSQFSRPLSKGGEEWVQRCGGVEGRPEHISAHFLRPPERAGQRLRSLLQSAPQPQISQLPPPPDPSRCLALEDRDGIRFVPYQDIATLTPAYPQRWRAVMKDGSLAYHPGSLPKGPWIALGTSWVRPEHLRREGDQWIDPGGFRYPYQQLECAPPVGPADEVLSLRKEGGVVSWHCDQGDRESDLEFDQAARQHPGMVRLSQLCYVNRHRLARLCCRTGESEHFLLDNGERVPYPAQHLQIEVARQLGLDNLRHLEPYNRVLFDYWLRDFPFEIARASAETLRLHFGRPEDLMANQIWQAYLYRRSGTGPTYGESYRDFYYMPLITTLLRAGFGHDKDRLLNLYEVMLHRFVFQYGFFTYTEFGFSDPRPDNRLIGSTRPEVVLILEKGGILEDYGLRLAARYGITMILLGRIPSLIDIEYFTKALKPHLRGPVSVIAYVDFDDMGWIIASSFVTQIQFYGVECQNLSHMVLPSCFSPQEIALLSRKIPLTNPSVAGRVAAWIEKSGGIEGQPRGIHANHLKPYPRVEARFQELFSCL